ncbi:DASH complex subunit Dad4 [Lipomyces japonicus]|uniref:DASH complex subunit Dad4 n=1 Tax=Lipomyces japonicus TaxID=56871 RepID=UPI0034CE5F75
MENPHEQVQNALLSRIITNVEKLNEAVIVLNRMLQDVNRENMNVELLSQMWENYQRNVLFNLESTDSLEKPI